MGKDKLTKYIKKNETDFISFIYKAFEGEMDDPIRKTEVLRVIAQSISVVPNKLQRQAFITSLAEKFKADGELITSLVGELQAMGKKEAPKQSEDVGFLTHFMSKAIGIFSIRKQYGANIHSFSQKNIHIPDRCSFSNRNTRSTGNTGTS